jgi:hypothetical protein
MRPLRHRSDQSSTEQISLIEVHWSLLYLMKTCFVPSEMLVNCSEEVEEAQKAETFKCFEMFHIVATVINYANGCKFGYRTVYLLHYMYPT